jgi:hypothetical protein
MLVGVSLAWGLSWPAMKIALDEIPPFSMRTGTSGLATITLFALAFLQHRRVRIPSTAARVHQLFGESVRAYQITLCPLRESPEHDLRCGSLGTSRHFQYTNGPAKNRTWCNQVKVIFANFGS